MRSLVAASALAVAYALWPEHGFEPQFKNFDGEGMRKIDGWKFGGTAELNENFLRLTPDRQSRRGFVWNTNKLDATKADTWSATVRFRTSGQGKRLFGDGVAFWATTHGGHRDGNLHGFTDTFKGFGIVLDTFVNNEPGHVHKDVQIVSSDGSAPRKLDDKPVGCDADFRYWEGRDDFSVANHSAMRVRFSGGRVSVWMDARATGAWVPCITDAVLSAPDGWQRDGLWIGLTASTGDLADNHDVLSVQVGLEDEPAAAPPALAGIGANLPTFTSTGDARMDESIRTAAAREAAILADRFVFVQHSLEHQLSSITDSLRTALKKLQEQESESQKRIDQLEKAIRERLEKNVNDKVDSKLDEGVTARLAKLENMVAAAVNTNLASRMQTDVLPALESKVAGLKQDVQNSVKSVQGGSTGIYVALVALAVIMCIVSSFAWTKYRKLQKMHMF